MYAIGNDEKAALPELGDTISCPQCALNHKIEYGTNPDTGEISKTLAFYSCRGTTYLAGVDGKDVTGHIARRRKEMTKKRKAKK